jgi:CRISPR-associated protein Csx17
MVLSEAMKAMHCQSGMAGYVEFSSCNTNSLLGWLKSLGLMSITGRSGFWHSDRFYLESESSEEVIEAFLSNYCPKPIASPWNKASGFLKTGGVDTYIETKAKRWSRVSTSFKEIQQRLAEVNLEKSSKELKLLLYPALRRGVRDRTFRDWLASVMLIRENKGIAEAELNPLLGTGGNISTVDLGATYLSCCGMIWNLQTGDPQPSSRKFAEASIANTPLQDSLVKKAVLCHMSPIADFLGELKNTSDVEDYPANQGPSTQLSNPVDFILAIEGLLNFSGCLSEMKDGEFQGWSVSHYPLLIEVNSGSADTSDRSQLSKHEVWLPVWDKPMTLEEFRADVLENLRFRLANQVSDTIDFLQLLANKSEGLKFERYARFGFWKRKGQGNYAIHVGLATPGGSDIGSELRIWRKLVKPHPKQSNKLYNQMMALEQSLTALTKGRASIQELIILLGQTELTLSEHEFSHHPPQPILSEAWVRQAYAEKPSPEFRLAAALASTDLRRYLSKAHYSKDKNSWFWSKKTQPVKSQSLLALADDLLRQWDKDEYHPSKRFHLKASRADIQLFIEGALDDPLILKLAIGLSLCRIPYGLFEDQFAPVPAAYQLAATLLWNKETILNHSAISGLQRGSTTGLQTNARQQGITCSLPPTTSNGQRIANALIFPIQFPRGNYVISES